MKVTTFALISSVVSIYVMGFMHGMLTYDFNKKPTVIEKTCHFTWSDNPTQIPAEHYGSNNYNESVEQFGAPDKVECE